MKTILVVEDEFLIAKAYESYIKKHISVNIIIVQTAADALKTFKEHIPNLILLDINLKNNESGLDLAYGIRKEFNMPIIFTTGNSNIEIDQKLKKISNSTTLLKPVNFEQLIELIKTKLQ
jgi:response regulator of citrate/malate metabolism